MAFQNTICISTRKSSFVVSFVVSFVCLPSRRHCNMIFTDHFNIAKNCKLTIWNTSFGQHSLAHFCHFSKFLFCFASELSENVWVAICNSSPILSESAVNASCRKTLYVLKFCRMLKRMKRKEKRHMGNESWDLCFPLFFPFSFKLPLKNVNVLLSFLRIID